MLDKNYKVEKGFIADLPSSLQAGARKMLTQEPLVEIISWNHNKIVLYFGKALDKEVALRVRNKMILTRITYFNPLSLTADNMRFLLSLARKTFGRTDLSAQELAVHCQVSYPVFASWLADVIKHLPVARSGRELKVKDYPSSDINWCR